MPQNTPETTERQGIDGWTPNLTAFGARLALIRQRMGWGNIAEAAKACSVAVESWRNWETNNVQPRDMVTVARQISQTTGCSYLWLLLGEQTERLEEAA